MDWQKIAGPTESEEEEEDEEEEKEKPAPIKIAVSEVLKRARKPAGKKSVSPKRINKKGRWNKFCPDQAILIKTLKELQLQLFVASSDTPTAMNMTSP